MSRILDARGWACPKPVIETRKALQTEDNLTVIVDNKAAKENVSRLAEKLQYNFSVDEKDDGIYISISREKVQVSTETNLVNDNGKIVILITSDTIGRGSDELGGILMRAFMHTFLEVEPKPEKIILVNSGIKLAVTGSPVVEDLKALSDNGVEVLVCGTCLNYFGLTDNLAAGQISNAYSIAESLLQADKVVNI